MGQSYPSSCSVTQMERALLFWAVDVVAVLPKPLDLREFVRAVQATVEQER